MRGRLAKIKRWLEAGQDFGRGTRRESGSALVESIMSIGILAMGLGGMVSYFGQVTESGTRNTALLTINDTSATVGKFSLTRGTLQWSARQPGNEALARCVPDPDQTGRDLQIKDCTSTADGVGFQLYDAGSNPPHMVAGTKAKPIWLDTHGADCDASKKACPFRSYAQFRALCADGAATCAEAQTILVSYTIEPNPEAKIWRTEISGEAPAGVDRDGKKYWAPMGITVTNQVDVNFARIWERLESGCPGAPSYKTAMYGINFAMKAMCADTSLTVDSSDEGPPGPPGPDGPQGPQGDPGPQGPPG